MPACRPAAISSAATLTRAGMAFHFPIWQLYYTLTEDQYLAKLFYNETINVVEVRQPVLC